MRGNEDKVVEVDHLTVHYDKTPVLWDLVFSIPYGKMVGVVGPNGAGKSTLLKAMIGQIKAISGRISFFGKPFKKVQRRIAYVPQRNSVDWNFPINGLDVVLMGRYGKLGPLKWPRRADVDAAMRALEMVGMEAFADRQISKLSGGQQQRIFLARAFLEDADIYLMDEPFAGVDIATEKAMIALFNQWKNQGKTLFIVHHDLSTVEQYFDWIILLNTFLIGCGPVSEVFRPDMIQKTYGKTGGLLEEVARLFQERGAGLDK